MEINYITAFLAGLMGAAHCAGMCGGIVGTLTLGLKTQPGKSLLPYILAYNSGRIFSYTIAGTILGGFSMLAANLVDIHAFQLALQFIAAIIMLLLGLYLGGWWMVLTRIENLGVPVWNKIEPFSRRFIPVTTISQALLLGILWGWLPCGLVYTMLFMAIASADAVQGALVMLSFGLGTLPALILMGVFASALKEVIQQKWVRQIAGISVILFAFYNFYLIFR